MNDVCVCDGSLSLISLFDGIGGFPLAFASAGVRTLATVEIDKAAAGVAADHFPEAKHFPDVTEVTPDELLGTGFCPVHGIFSAGWPCTDLSLAGLRLGLGGARSGLVGEVFRLLLGVRPRWFVLENVPGLLSSVCPCPGDGACTAPGCSAPHTVRGGACGRARRAGRAHGSGRCMALHGGGMGTVLRRLGECGYGVAYRVLDAQHFGVPQRRRRVVIVGRLGDAAGPVEVLLEPEGRGGHPAAGGTPFERIAGGPGEGSALSGESNVAPTLQEGGRRGFRVDAETAAGNGLLVDARGEGVYESAFTASMAGAGGGVDDNTAQGGHLVAATLTRRHGKGPSSDLPDGHVVAVGVDLAQITSGTNRSNPRPGDPQPSLAATGRPAVAYQQHGTNVGPMGTLRSGSGTGGVPFLSDPSAVLGSVTHALTAEGSDASKDGTGRGTPVIAFGHTNGIDLQADEHVAPTMKASNGAGGGAALPRQDGSTQDQVVSPDAVSPTLAHASNAHGGHHQPKVLEADAAVRRLTPVECERLQGYPDGWTATSHGRPQSDSARYRQLGNSIAVPVFVWVAHRLVAAERGEGL